MQTTVGDVLPVHAAMRFNAQGLTRVPALLLRQHGSRQLATEGQMLFNSTRLRIDPTPRRADGEFIAHVRIVTILEDGDEREVHASGDLAGFDVRDDAVAYATKWAEEWLAAQSG
ncbi:hypothetical protein ACVK00_006570 [Burkholderia sp. PvR073]